MTEQTQAAASDAASFTPGDSVDPVDPQDARDSAQWLRLLGEGRIEAFARERTGVFDGFAYRRFVEDLEASDLAPSDRQRLEAITRAALLAEARSGAPRTTGAADLTDSVAAVEGEADLALNTANGARRVVERALWRERRDHDARVRDDTAALVQWLARPVVVSWSELEARARAADLGHADLTAVRRAFDEARARRRRRIRRGLVTVAALAVACWVLARGFEGSALTPGPVAQPPRQRARPRPRPTTPTPEPARTTPSPSRSRSPGHVDPQPSPRLSPERPEPPSSLSPERPDPSPHDPPLG